MTHSSKTAMFRHNKVKTAGATALAGALILAGSMAYFTDHETAKATATAGTVDLTLTEAWADVSNFNPGDQADFSYTIANAGNKSIDVRETIVLTSSVAMDAATQAEFELYKASDVQQQANGSYVPVDGASPVTTGANRIVSDDNMSIQYEIDQYVLNGTGDNAEQEDGVTDTSKASDYVLVFRSDSGNDFQGAELSVDFVAQAKQHKNTDDDVWTTVQSESVTLGSTTVPVVPTK